tara:strand:- start:20209 stop:20907 length:699 start_codon:yes stop_codon:yes gene_type:complete
MINNFGVIVLVRYNSSRLYGKALLELNGKPALKYLIDRLTILFKKEQIIIATSTENHDNEIEKFSIKNNLKCYRGSLKNVSKRFMEASKILNKKYSIRITGDSIFIDTSIIKNIIKKVDSKHFIFSNRKCKKYPVGQTIDIINTRKFIEYLKMFKSNEDFEHVTSYFFKNEDKFKIKHLDNHSGIFRDVSLGLDTNKDYQNATIFLKNFKNYNPKTTYLEIYNYYNNLKNDK